MPTGTVKWFNPDTALSQAGTSHLLVCRHSDAAPEGALSELDLVALGGP